MPSVRKQLSVHGKLSFFLPTGLELIYFLSKYAYNLSLSLMKISIFSSHLQVTPLEIPKKLVVTCFVVPLLE